MYKSHPRQLGIFHCSALDLLRIMYTTEHTWIKRHLAECECIRSYSQVTFLRSVLNNRHNQLIMISEMTREFRQNSDTMYIRTYHPSKTTPYSRQGFIWIVLCWEEEAWGKHETCPLNPPFPQPYPPGNNET